MHLKKCLLIIILCFNAIFVDEAKNQQSPSCPIKSIRVKVLLDEQPNHNHMPWNIASEADIRIIDPDSPEKNINLRTRDLSITLHKGNLYLNNHPIKTKKIIISPIKGHLSFKGKSYAGSLLVMVKDNKHYVINLVDLEDYVCSVLKTESWPGWPLEVNKVFAIACRSYALAMIMRAGKSDLPYHVKNSNAHQTYSGVHNNQVLKTAVEQTAGVFLSHDDKPIIAMFDCCCGGVIPSRIADFDFKKAPYLSRDYPCSFCKQCKIYKWSKEFAIKDLERIFNDFFLHDLRLRELKVSKQDKAGLVEEVFLRCGRKAATISGKKLYSLLPEVKSYCFTIRRRGTTYTISGRGYGHHLGLCQWGARQMVKDGWDYQSILQFYYPGTRQVVLR